MVAHIKGRTEAEVVWEQGAEADTETYDGVGGGLLQESASRSVVQLACRYMEGETLWGSTKEREHLEDVG